MNNSRSIIGRLRDLYHRILVRNFLANSARPHFVPKSTTVHPVPLMEEMEPRLMLSAFTAGQVLSIQNGLTAFDTEVSTLNASTAMVTQSTLWTGQLGAVFNLENEFLDGFINPSDAYFTMDASPTSEEWISYLSTQNSLRSNVTSSTITAASGFTGVEFSVTRVLDVGNISIDLTEAVADQYLSYLGFDETPGSLSADLMTSVTVSFSAGIDGSGNFFVTPASSSFDVYLDDNSTISFTLGMFSMETGNVSGDLLSADIDWNDPNSDGKIYTAEMTGSMLDTSVSSSSAAYDVEIVLDDTTGTGVLDSIGAAATLNFTAENLNSDFSCTSITGLQDLVYLASLRPDSIAAGLEQLSLAFNGMGSVNGVLVDLPFTHGVSFGDILNFSRAITEGFNSSLVTYNEDGSRNILFATFDELLSGISSQLQSVTYSAVNRSFELDIAFSYDFTAFDTMVNFDEGLTEVYLSSSSTASLDGSVDVAFTFEIKLGPEQGISLVAFGETCVSAQGTDASVQSGYLEWDEVFDIDISTDWGTDTRIHLEWADTLGNSNLLDFVADINAKIAAAGLGSDVEAYLVDYNFLGAEVTAEDMAGAVPGSDETYDGTGRIAFRTLDQSIWALRVTVPSTSDNVATSLFGLEDNAEKPGVSDLYIDNTAVDASVTLTSSDIDATGTIGAIEFSAPNGVMSLSGTASGNLVHPDTSATRISLVDVLDIISRMNEMITLDFAGSGSVRFEDITISGITGVDMGDNPAIEIGVVDISGGMAESNLTETFEDLDSVIQFEDVDSDKIVTTLDAGVGFFENLLDVGLLDFKIPLINLNVLDTLDLSGTFGTMTRAVSAGITAGTTLQALSAQVGQLIATQFPDVVFALSLDGDNLKLEMDYSLTVSDSISFALNMSDLLALAVGDTSAADVISSITGQGASGVVNLAATASIHLALGLDASWDTFVYDETNLTLGARVEGESLEFNFTVGSLGFYVLDGWAVVDGDGDPDTDDYVEYVITLDDGDSDGKHYFNAVDPMSDDITVSLSGQAAVSLPVYFPNPSLPFGGAGNNEVTITIPDIVAFANGEADSVTITTPDFTSQFDGITIISVLNNPYMLVDGLQTSFNLVGSTVQAVMDGMNLPLVGDSLSATASFVTDAGNELLNFVRSAINEALDGSSPIELIQQSLFSAFGPSGLDILLDSTDDSQVTIDDILVTLDDVDWMYVEYDMDLGGNLWSDSIAFDLGVDGLPLSLDGELAVSLDWLWDFGFGIHATDGFYLIDDPEDGREITITLGVNMPQQLTGSLFFLEAAAVPMNAELTAIDYDRYLLYGQFYVDISEPSGDGHLTVSEIRTNAVSDLVSAGFTGVLDADLRVTFSIGDSDLFPQIRSIISLDWSIDQTLGGTRDISEMTVEFQDVQLNFGSFVSGFLKPVCNEVNKVMEPIRPALDFISSDLPVINMSPMDIASAFADGTKYAAAVDFINLVIWIDDIVEDIAAMPEGDIWIDLGSFSASPTESGTITSSDPGDFDTSLNGSEVDSSSKNTMSSLQGESLFQMHILEPATIFGLLMGHEVTLFTFELPEMKFTASYSYFQSIFGPLGMRLGGSFSVEAHLAFGYDTYGISKAMETGNYAYILDGFYVSDRANADGTGADIPECSFTIEFMAGGEVNVGIARGGVYGSLAGTFNFNLNDPNNDGKLRAAELVENMAQGFEYVFDMSALITARIYWEVTIGVGPFSVSKSGTLVSATLWEQEWSAASTPILISESTGQANYVVNVGTFAANRQHGDVSDGADIITITSTSITIGGESQSFSNSASDTILIKTGDGDDVVVIAADVEATIIVYGGSGNDTITMNGSGRLIAYGEDGDDTITGGSGNDLIYGGAGNDILNGGAGNDTIDGGEGNDTIDGGAGDDTIIFTGAFGMDTVTPGSGTDTLDFSTYTNPLFYNLTTMLLTTPVGDKVTLTAYAERVKGGTNIDEIYGLDQDNTWHITGGDAGEYNSLFTFESFESLTGRSGADTFVFDDQAYISVSIDGGSGVEDEEGATYWQQVNADKLDLSAYTTNNRLQVGDVDGGVLYTSTSNPAFSNIESYIGGSARDYLVLDDDQYITGMFDGGDGYDRIEISDYKLHGYYKKNVWDFTGVNSGSVNERTAFQNCENYTGGNNEDIFYIYPIGVYEEGFLHAPASTGAGGSINGTIDAQGENDIISDSPTVRTSGMIPQPILSSVVIEAPQDSQDQGLAMTLNSVIDPNDYDVIWEITGTNSGTRTDDDGSVDFTNLQNIEGSAGRDLFIIYPDGAMSGYIDGKGGLDTLVYGWGANLYTDPVTINYTTTTQATATATGFVANIELYKAGTSTSDYFKGPDAASTWTITGENTGTVGLGASLVAFEGFDNISGGTGEDTFQFDAAAIVTGSITGGGGKDAINLSAYSTDVEWNITGTDSGTLSIEGADAITFTDIDTLVGSQGDDTIVFGANGVITDTINGSGHGAAGDTLNYSAVSTSMTWNINYEGGGQISRLGGNTTFLGIETILAGTGVDEFIFAPNGSIDGVIDGGDGLDTFNYSALGVLSPVTVNLETNVATGVDNFYNVENFIGGKSSGNTYTAPDGVDITWTIFEVNDGSVEIEGQASPWYFFDFQHLVGGSGNDTFNFDDLYYVKGPIEGSGGNDTLNFGGYSLYQAWTLSSAGGGNLQMTQTQDPVNIQFSGIENIVTGDNDNLFTITNLASLDSLTMGSGTDTINMSGYGQAVTVDLPTDSITPITLVTGYENMVGTAYSDTIHGRELADGVSGPMIWAVYGTNSIYYDCTVSEGSVTDWDINFTAFENLEGNIDSDQYWFQTGGSVGGNVHDDLNGNILTYAGRSASVTIDIEDRTATGIGGTWDNIQNFVGGDGVDTLGSADDTENATTWVISGTDSGTVTTDSDSWTFQSIGNLTGKTGDDTFVFADGATQSGVLTGAGGSNSLDYSAYSTSVTVDLENDSATGTAGISGINDEITGGSALDTLVGPDADSVWTISSANGGTLVADSNTYTFSSMNNLTSLSGDDTFAFTATGEGDYINSIDSGTGWDHLDYSSQTGDVTVNRRTQAASRVTETIDGFEELTGSTGGNDTLVGLDEESQWNITEDNGGNVNGSDIFQFHAFENLTGGSEADTFVLSDTMTADGTINGAGGENSLDLSDHTSGWDIAVTSDNAGTRNTKAFSNIQNITGSQGDDSVTLSDGAGLSGNLDGQGGTDSIDYSDYSTAMAVNIEDNTATNIGGTLTNFESFTGGAGSDTFTGPDADSDWALSSAGGGTVVTDSLGLTFASMENLVSQSGADTFTIGASGSAETLDTGDGVDLLDYSALATPISVNLQANTATGFSISATGFESVNAGSSTSDSLTARNQANAWNFTGAGDGTINTDELTFSNFETVTGGTGDDTFTFAAGGSITGGVHGSDGDDTMDVSSKSVGVEVEATADNAGTINGVPFTGIENLTLTQGDDSVTFSDGVEFGGSLDGQGGTDSLDYSAYTTDVTVDLAEETGTGAAELVSFEDITGGQATTTLNAMWDDDTIWTMTGPYSGIITKGDDTYTFAAVDIMMAGSGSNTIDYSLLEAPVTIDYDDVVGSGFSTVIADGDGNILNGSDTVNTWNILSLDTGTLNVISFEGFGTLVGGNLADTFIFANGAVVTDSVDGGDGIDMIDLTAYLTYNSWVPTGNGDEIRIETVNGNFTYTNIENFDGNMSVYLFPNEDIAAGFGTLNLPDAMAPGESLVVPITVTNLSNALFNKRINIELYASSDTTLDDDDVLIGSLVNKKVTVSQGKTEGYNITALFPETLAYGEYYLIVSIDTQDVIDEIDEVNNIAASGETQLIAAMFGTLGDRSGVPLLIEMDNGDTVLFELSGPGEAVLTGDNLDHLELTGTTIASVLRAKVTSPTNVQYSVGELVVNGDIGTINFSQLDLRTSITVTGGLKTLRLDDVLGDEASTITIGTSTWSATMRFDELNDVVIQTGSPIKSFTASVWNDDDETADSLTGTQVTDIIIDTTMDASVNADSIHKLQTGGDMSGNVNVTDNLDILRVTADAGGVGALKISETGMLGSLTAGAVGLVDIKGDWAGNVTVDSINKAVVSGDVSGTITVDGAFNVFNITGNLTGDLTAASMKTLRVGGNVTSETQIEGTLANIYVTGGDLSGRIQAAVINKAMLQTLSGQLFAFDMLKNVKVVGGNLTGYVGTNGTLNFIQIKSAAGVGGAVDGGIIQAGDELKMLKIEQDSTATIRSKWIKTINAQGSLGGEIVSDGTIANYPTKANTYNIYNLIVVGDLTSAITAGSIKNINAKADSSATIELDGSTRGTALKMLNVLGDASGTEITSTEGGLYTIKAKQWDGGSITAPAIKTIIVNNVAGNDDLNGLFNVDMDIDITGFAQANKWRYAVKNLKVQQVTGTALDNVVWDIVGNVQMLNVPGQVDYLDLNVTGDVKKAMFGGLFDSTLDGSGTLTQFKITGLGTDAVYTSGSNITFDTVRKGYLRNQDENDPTQFVVSALGDVRYLNYVDTRTDPTAWPDDLSSWTWRPNRAAPWTDVSPLLVV